MSNYIKVQKTMKDNSKLSKKEIFTALGVGAVFGLISVIIERVFNN